MAAIKADRQGSLDHLNFVKIKKKLFKKIYIFLLIKKNE